jgi:hypothetical protein
MSKIWIVRIIAMAIYAIVGAVLLILKFSWVPWMLPILGLVAAVVVWLITNRLKPSDDIDLGEHEPWFDNGRKDPRE